MEVSLATLRKCIVCLLSAGLVFLTVACDKKGAKLNSRAQSQEGVVAKIDDAEITLSEVDQRILLKRHDLYLAEYQLRFETLSEIIEEYLRRVPPESIKPSVDWLLSYPQPPRLNIDLSGRSLRGNPEAPIKLAVFCSYQSVHCASLNRVLHRLLDDYAGWIAIALFDFPMHYHRQAKAAAVAARCAGVQGLAWLYADGLYVRAKALTEQVFEQLATQLDLSSEPFKRCLAREDLHEAIARDSALARALGLQSVPVVFVNGLYVKGPMPYEHYAMWIEQESNRLGFSIAEPHPQAEAFRENSAKLTETQLPLALSGTSISSNGENSTALIAVRDDPARKFSVGDAVLTDVSLLAIRRHYVILDVKGRRERLSLKGESGTYVRVPLTSALERDEETMRRIEQLEGSAGKLVEPSAVVPLGREWLEQQLEHRAELEKKFVNAEHVVDGHNLLKLESIDSNEFFTALGFEDGDVVLRVNDTWVHSGQNQLWEALTSGQVVDVVFMRKGLPQRLQYIVREKGYFEQPENGQ